MTRGIGSYFKMCRNSCRGPGDFGFNLKWYEKIVFGYSGIRVFCASVNSYVNI